MSPRSAAWVFLLIAGCDSVGGDSAISGAAPDFAGGFTRSPQVSSMEAMPNSSAPEPVTLPAPSPLSPAACSSDLEAFNQVYGGCPEQRPDVEGCSVEGLECLYRASGVAEFLDAGVDTDAGANAERGCFDVVACKFALWSALGERCPGPLTLTPGSLTHDPDPQVAAPMSSATAATFPFPTQMPPSVPLDAGDVGAPAVSSTLADASVLGAVDAGRAAPLDASLAQSWTSQRDAAALDAGLDLPLEEASDAASPTSPEDTWGAADAGAPTTADSASEAGPPSTTPIEDTSTCPELSPVPGSPCNDSVMCGYGQCEDLSSQLYAVCVCGRWVAYPGACDPSTGAQP